MMRIRVGLAVTGLLMITAPTAWAVDSTPPSVPGNVREIGMFAGQPVLGWDASLDDAGSISYYRVLVNGSMAYRPRVTQVKIDDLVKYCHVFPGNLYSISIQAVDSTGNRSAASNAIDVKVH